MPSEAVLDGSPPQPRAPQGSVIASVLAHWPLALVCLAFLVPTIIRLAKDSWTLEIGAHGPIVLATGLWLLSRCDWTRSPEDTSETGRNAAWLGIAVSLACYVFGRAYDFLVLEAAAVYFALIGVLVLVVGPRAVLRNAFPLFYLAFLIPPPGWVIDLITAPLQHFISYVATETMRAFGYPVLRSGVAIEVAQYRLLVEQACSGMNSIVGLTAVTLFYIYLLHGSSWRYALVLIALILPIAVFVNFLRVMTLILVTYHYGDGVAQGVFHNTAGVALFAVALALMFAIDAGLRKVLKGRLG